MKKFIRALIRIHNNLLNSLKINAINKIINITIGFRCIKNTENLNNERIMGWKLNNMQEEWGRTHKGEHTKG